MNTSASPHIMAGAVKKPSKAPPFCVFLRIKLSIIIKYEIPDINPTESSPYFIFKNLSIFIFKFFYI